MATAIQDAWYYRGIALHHLGRNEQAIASYDKAIEIKPDLQDAWYNKACCYVLQNPFDKGIEHLAKAIDLNTKWRDKAKTDSDFDSIRDDEQFKALIQG